MNTQYKINDEGMTRTGSRPFENNPKASSSALCSMQSVAPNAVDINFVNSESDSESRDDTGTLDALHRYSQSDHIPDKTHPNHRLNKSGGNGNEEVAQSPMPLQLDFDDEEDITMGSF